MSNFTQLLDSYLKDHTKIKIQRPSNSQQQTNSKLLKAFSKTMLIEKQNYSNRELTQTKANYTTTIEKSLPEIKYNINDLLPQQNNLKNYNIIEKSILKEGKENILQTIQTKTIEKQNRIVFKETQTSLEQKVNKMLASCLLEFSLDQQAFTGRIINNDIIQSLSRNLVHFITNYSKKTSKKKHKKLTSESFQIFQSLNQKEQKITKSKAIQTVNFDMNQPQNTVRSGYSCYSGRKQSTESRFIKFSQDSHKNINSYKIPRDQRRTSLTQWQSQKFSKHLRQTESFQNLLKMQEPSKLKSNSVNLLEVINTDKTQCEKIIKIQRFFRNFLQKPPIQIQSKSKRFSLNTINSAKKKKLNEFVELPFILKNELLYLQEILNQGN